MIDPSELDMAQLKFEFRQMYKNIGLAGSIQVLYEMVLSAHTLAEIIDEERTKK